MVVKLGNEKDVPAITNEATVLKFIEKPYVGSFYCIVDTILEHREKLHDSWDKTLNTTQTPMFVDKSFVLKTELKFNDGMSYVYITRMGMDAIMALISQGIIMIVDRQHKILLPIKFTCERSLIEVLTMVGSVAENYRKTGFGGARIVRKGGM